MFKRWGESDDEMMSGLLLGGREVSHAEIQEIASSRLGALDCGVPAHLVAEYEAGGGTFGPGDLHRWLLARTEPVDTGWTLIHSYSRRQAIEDGTLVDVTSEAKETGFRIPVAVTRAVYESHVKVPPKVVCQDERGRLHDILWMLHVAIKRGGMEADTVYFKLHVRSSNRQGTPPLVQLRAVCGPGDDPRPVITIMKIGED